MLAAAALGVTLLSGPVIGGAHPAGAAGKLALAAAVGGLFVMVTGAIRLLGVCRRPVEGPDPQQLTAELKRGGMLDDEAAFYESMIARLGDRRKAVEIAFEHLDTSFTAMVWGILVMLGGLALAAIVG